ncbi:MAG TPA: glycosyltransferase [Thermomicrobiaceae bacterium]|nr:glycosyltransferase [Thermomicrobiaceae bacterium]
MSSAVLFISGEYPPMHGGVGDYTARLAAALEAEGWNPAVLTSQAVYPSPAGVYSEVGRWSWRLLGKARRTAFQVGAAIVHIQYQTGAFGMHPAINLLPWSLRRGGQLPSVTTFHDLREPYLFPKAGALRPLVNRVLASGSDAVVVTNPEDRRRLEKIRGLKRKVQLIPIGSNLPLPPAVDRSSVLSRYGVRPSERVVGFFGFPTPDKGIELLLRALADYGEGVPRLMIVGGELADTDRSNREFARALYQRLQRLQPHPVITGHLPEQEAAAVLASTDLIALPFRHGASLRNGSLLAALASGRPVITTAPRRFDDLLPFRDRESLLLVPDGDAVTLRDTMRNVLDGSDFSEIGMQAREHLGSHRWQSIARRHIELYESLLRGRTERALG